MAARELFTLMSDGLKKNFNICDFAFPKNITLSMCITRKTMPTNDVSAP